MLTKRVIPCLDVRGGRVVKGIRFANLRDAGDPVAQAARYEAQGADEIVMLDVSATSEGRGTTLDVVRKLRRTLSIPLTVGGGVRVAADALALLSVGADKVAVNTAAVHRPALLGELAERVGRQCVVLAIDAALRPQLDGWEVVTHAGTQRTGMDAIAWAAQGEASGAGEILLTSWDRDGTRSGYDLSLIGAMASMVRLPIVASGGASTAAHMADALNAGADAVLAASIFHDSEVTVATVKASLRDMRMEIRL